MGDLYLTIITFITEQRSYQSVFPKQKASVCVGHLHRGDGTIPFVYDSVHTITLN